MPPKLTPAEQKVVEEFWKDLEIDGVWYKGTRHWKSPHKKRLINKKLTTLLLAHRAEKEEAAAEARREVYEAIMSLPAWYIDDAEGHFRDKVLSLVTPPNTK